MSKVVFEFINGKLVGLPVGDANGIAGLDSGGKVPSAQLPASVTGALNYQGAWNASTNSPTLASGVGTQGYYYKVSVAGTTNIDGITSWDVGDFIAFNGTTWDKFEGNIGNLTANYIPKATSASSLGNSLIFDNGTSVGIGTATPNSQLHITGNMSMNAGRYIIGQRTIDSTWQNILGTEGDDTIIYFMRSTVSKIFFRDTTPENIMTLTSEGNVGIGPTTPTAVIHLKAGTATANTAPFKFTLTSAVLNTTAEAGAVEVDSSGNLYITDSSAVRGQLLVGRINTQTGITYTVAATDFSIISNYAGTQTLTLPTASSYPGRVLNLRTITANTVISASSNVVPLAGGAAGTAILAATAGRWAMLQSDGTNWQIMSAN